MAFQIQGLLRHYDVLCLLAEATGQLRRAYVASCEKLKAMAAEMVEIPVMVILLMARF